MTKRGGLWGPVRPFPGRGLLAFVEVLLGMGAVAEGLVAGGAAAAEGHALALLPVVAVSSDEGDAAAEPEWATGDKRYLGFERNFEGLAVGERDDAAGRA